MVPFEQIKSSMLSVDSIKPPLARDEMTDEEFRAMIYECLEQTKNGDYMDIQDAFVLLRSEIQ